MTSPADRLKAARIAAGYETALEASNSMGIPSATYNQAERGTRPLTVESAQRYARFFRTTPEFLLYGRSGTSIEPSVGELEEMVRDVLSEVLTLDLKIADLPRIVAPSLHEQLTRFREDRARRPGFGRHSVAANDGSREPTT